MRKLTQLILRAAVCLVLAEAGKAKAATAESISFNRDIRPILSDNCFHCHGFDQKTRKGKFRLDVREDAVAKQAIVPGKPEESGIIERIFTTNQDDVMPPLDAHKTLTAAQKELLRRWIASGAKYEKHWAYVLPVKAVTPPKKNPVDFLVQEKLRADGLKPSKPADRATLARRLYFDLIGLPPTPQEVDAFTRDKSKGAVSNLVEKLLASPQFGERMAIGWLDVVRFADTIGYHSDTARNVWPYRDYVIKAFNEDMPFDRFTREQLAGDLLPNSTQEQKVASAYNRLLLSTEEGGAQAKDYEARMLTDRVRDVSAVWLGQTTGCAQCHDHKFDPIKQRDFYAMGAFFADIEEPIIGPRGPGMLVLDDKQKVELARLDGELASAQKKFDAPHPEWQTAFNDWQTRETAVALQEQRWTLLTPAKAVTGTGADLKIEPDGSVIPAKKKDAITDYVVTFTNRLNGIAGIRIETLTNDVATGKANSGDFVLTQLTGEIHGAHQTTNAITFNLARADFEAAAKSAKETNKVFGARTVIDKALETKRNGGWSVFPQTNQTHQLVLGLSEALSLQPGETLTLALKQQRKANSVAHFRIAVTTNAEALQGPLQSPLAREITDVLIIPVEKRDAKQKETLWAYFKNSAPEATGTRQQIVEARKVRDDYEATIPRCLVSVSSPTPRVVRVLPRGNFLAENGDILQPAFPGYLVDTNQPQKSGRLTRLDLANFLVARENPLTARVVMNRLWKQFFGMGLSKVVDDFGAQGELPPNQPLLDWLACEFMDSGWDTKHMIRVIVNSDTYQQTSIPTKELRARDPYNRELAVQGRWRLDAELVRDNALAVSGLLVEKVGGPSVKPYQPAGYWDNLNFPPRTYTASEGADEYRRGLYTWWQRSYIHPSMAAFDAPTREECAAERNRSNIPQQALVLLNDPTYVEASRALAERILKEGGGDTKARMTWAWREVLSRAPRKEEVKAVEALLNEQLAQYRANPAAAKALVKVGASPEAKNLNDSELAAWTNIARVILNLHETITRS